MFGSRLGMGTCLRLGKLGYSAFNLFRGSYSILETNVMIDFAIGLVINRLVPYVSRF